MADFQAAAASSSSSSVGMMKKKISTATTTILLLLLLVTTTYCQGVSASRSMPPAANAPATSESADHNNIKSEDEGVIYMVGDEGGWTVIPGCGLQDFQAWADALTFHPGDTLRFWYSNSSDNSLIQVNRKDYENCSLTTPLVVYPSDGDIYVKLEREGDYYFVSGSHNYCNIAFQKVHIKVIPRPPRTTAAAPPHSPSSYKASTSGSSAPASYADHHTSSATSISPTQRMYRWIIFGLSLMVVISYV